MTITPASATSQLVEQENKLLEALAMYHKHLRVAKVEEVKPGTALYYPLAGEYGVHIVRGPEDIKQGYVYKDPAGLRAGVEAGKFLILDDNGENSSLV